MTDKLVKFWRNQARQRKVFIFLLAWLVSLLLWFLTAINATYSHTFQVSIFARPVLEDMQLEGDSVRKLNLELYGRGLELIQQYQRLKKIAFSVYPGKYEDSSLVSTRDIEAEINAQLLPKLRLVRLYPDTFHFRFQKLYGRNVAIQPNFKLSFMPGFGQTGDLKFLPDSIRVFSFKPFISTPLPLQIELQEFTRLKTTLRIVSQLVHPPDTMLFIRKEQVMVEIPVHRITEGRLILPIRLQPTVPGIRLVPATVEITYEAALHHFKTITAADFQVMCNWKDKTDKGHLQVTVVCTRPEVLRYQVFPKQIDYILP